MAFLVCCPTRFWQQILYLVPWLLLEKNNLFLFLALTVLLVSYLVSFALSNYTTSQKISILMSKNRAWWYLQLIITDHSFFCRLPDKGKYFKSSYCFSDTSHSIFGYCGGTNNEFTSARPIRDQ